MLVREAMTTPVVSVPRTATIRQAIRVLYQHRITAAPVVDEEDRLVGIVSEMDLLRGEFEADPRAFMRPVATPAEPPPRHVDEVMTTNVRTTRPASDVAELAEMMMTTGIKSVPVLDGTELIGIITRHDLLAVLARSDTRIRDDVQAAIASTLPDAEAWDVRVKDGVVELHGPADERAKRLSEVVARTVPGATRVVVISPSGDQANDPRP